MMKQIILLVVAITLIVVCIGKVAVFKYNNWVKETACINEHVSAGIERRNIKTNNGKCYVKTNER